MTTAQLESLHAPARFPHLTRAVELQPDNTEMRFVLGRALLELRRTAEAAAQWEEALSLNPNHAGAREALDGLRQTRSR